MRRAAFFTVATLFGVTALGQGLLDCVEPDVLRALLLQAQGERAPVITGAVPPELAALRMPREFTWIGSAERTVGRADATTNISQVTAAYRSSLAPDAARTATITALTASGWEVRPAMGMGTSVFTSSAAPVTQPACREGKPVNVTVNAMNGVTYVLFAVQRGNNNSICNQPVRPEMMMAGSAIARHMPRLDMPADPATGAAARMQSLGSSGMGDSAINVRLEFSVKDSAGNLARQFATQMAQQGWASDANWTGATTAGSSWSKRADGAVIQSTLMVTAVDEQQFIASFRAMRLP
jgi:hypothetical protein